jgi:hypothetical protein
VQNQPELEARVRYCELDVVLPGLFDGLAEAGVVPWPLDVEHAPELVDLGFLIEGLAAGGCRHGHESSGHRSAVPGLDPKIDRGRIAYGRLPF